MKKVHQSQLNQCFFKQEQRKGDGISPRLGELFKMGRDGHKRYYATIQNESGAYFEIEHALAIYNSPNYKNPAGQILYTPDIEFASLGLEIKITRAKRSSLPYPKDLRQAKFYAEQLGKDFIVKYVNEDLKLVWDEICSAATEEITPIFVERARVWFEGKRPRNPLDEKECIFCPYNSGVCWQWLEVRKDLQVKIESWKPESNDGGGGISTPVKKNPNRED